jgi:hypothetical protein
VPGTGRNVAGNFVSAYDKANRRWHHLSPSLLDAYENCNRIPFYDKILKLPKPPYKAQQLGTLLHSQMEHLVLTGQDVLDPRLKPVRKYLPAVLPNSLVIPELGLDGKRRQDGAGYDFANAPTLLGRPVEGYIDYADWRVGTFGPSDYKTSSDVNKWKKTEDQLRKNLQLGIYAWWMAEKGSLVTEVTVRHLYAQTKGVVLADEVAVSLSLADVNFTVQHAESLARGLIDIEGETTDANIEPTGKKSGFCHAYNRQCPYFSACFKRPEAMLEERVRAVRAINESRNQKITGESNTGKAESMNLMARIKTQPPAAPAQQAPPAPPAPAQPPDAPRARETYPTDGPGWVEVSCSCCGAPVGKRPPGATVSVHDGCTNPGGVKRSLSIPEDVQPASAEDIARARQKNQGIVPPDAPPNDVNAVVEERKKKRGRPPGSVNKPTNISPATAQTATGTLILGGANVQSTGPATGLAPVAGTVSPTPVVATSAEAPAKDSGSTPATGGEGVVSKLEIHLHINCIPYHEPYVHLDAFASELADAVCTDRQVLDFRLGDRGAVEGKGFISALVRVRAAQLPPGNYVAIVSGFDSPLSVVVDTLRPLCAKVTQGVR